VGKERRSLLAPQRNGGNAQEGIVLPQDNGPRLRPTLVPIFDPGVAIRIGERTLEQYLGVFAHYRLKGNLDDFDSARDLINQLYADDNSNAVVCWINGCALFVCLGGCGQFDKDVVAGVGVIAIDTGVLVEELGFGTIFLCYAGQTTPLAKDQILHTLFARNLLGEIRAGITGLTDIDANFLARFVHSESGRLFSACSFEAEASIHLVSDRKCRPLFVKKNKILDKGTRLVDHMITSGIKLTSISASCLAMLSYRNLTRLVRATEDRGISPVVVLKRDCRVDYSFDDGMYGNMPIYDDDRVDESHARDRAVALIRLLNVGCRIEFACKGRALSHYEIDTYRTLHQEGLLKELKIHHESGHPMVLDPLYVCVPSLSKVTYCFTDANIQCRPYMFGIEKIRGLRSLHFVFDKEAGQPVDLATALAATVEEHDLMIEVYGLERDSEIVTSATVTNMDHAAQSLYMVPHLLERYGLSVNECFEFLRRVGGRIPYDQSPPMMKGAGTVSKKQFTGMKRRRAGWQTALGL